MDIERFIFVLIAYKYYDELRTYLFFDINKIYKNLQCIRGVILNVHDHFYVSQLKHVINN